MYTFDETQCDESLASCKSFELDQASSNKQNAFDQIKLDTCEDIRAICAKTDHNQVNL